MSWQSAWAWGLSSLQLMLLTLTTHPSPLTSSHLCPPHDELLPSGRRDRDLANSQQYNRLNGNFIMKSSKLLRIVANHYFNISSFLYYVLFLLFLPQDMGITLESKHKLDMEYSKLVAMRIINAEALKSALSNYVGWEAGKVYNEGNLVVNININGVITLSGEKTRLVKNTKPAVC